MSKEQSVFILFENERMYSKELRHGDPGQPWPCPASLLLHTVGSNSRFSPLIFSSMARYLSPLDGSRIATRIFRESIARCFRTIDVRIISSLKLFVPLQHILPYSNSASCCYVELLFILAALIFMRPFIQFFL